MNETHWYFQVLRKGLDFVNAENVSDLFATNFISNAGVSRYLVRNIVGEKENSGDQECSFSHNVFNSFLPHIRHNIREFGTGLILDQYFCQLLFPCI